MTFKNFVYFTKEKKAMPIEEMKEEEKVKMVEEGIKEFMKEAGIQALERCEKHDE